MNNDARVHGDEADGYGFGDDQDSEVLYKDFENDDLDGSDHLERDRETDGVLGDNDDFEDEGDDFHETARKSRKAGGNGRGALRYEDFGNGSDDDIHDKEVEDEEIAYGDNPDGGVLDDEEQIDGGGWEPENDDRER
jgi:hypothetical protein